MSKTEKQTEEEILSLFFERQETAIEAFAAYDGNCCYRIAYGITENKESAEECVDDLYLQLWNTIPPEHPKSLRAYACKIVRNLALNLIKKQKTQKRAALLVELDESTADIPDAEPSEIGAILNEFLEKQPRVRALIFMRRYYYSDSVAHIAKITGFDENKVSRILSKMRKELKKYLERGGINV